MRIPAAVTTHVLLKIADVDPAALMHIKEALTLPNDAKESAIREGVRGAENLPDWIQLYKLEGPWIRLPRGFAARLQKGFSKQGIAIDWDDRRIRRDIDLSQLKPITLRKHQPEAVRRMLEVQQGIYQAPPGSGKTVTALEAWRRSGQRGLILLNRSNIARQWISRSEQFLDYTPGLVGDGTWLEDDLTIAMVQTLWSRRDELDKKRWWRNFGFVLVDECHHTPATTFTEIVQRFPARIRLGVSATPDRGENDLRLATAVLGNIFHETGKEALVDAGVLVKPKVVVVPTKFDFDFQPTIRKGNRVIRRNNYASMMSALSSDKTRNQLIVKHIERDHHNLVVSRHLEHLRLIHDACLAAGWPQSRVFSMTGKESSQERNDIGAAVAGMHECVIVSTVADEAVDIPILDRLHLAFPGRKSYKVTQKIGRIERAHPGKRDAVAYDYYDERIGVLKSQFRARRAEVYARASLTVEVMNGGGPR